MTSQDNAGTLDADQTISPPPVIHKPSEGAVARARRVVREDTSAIHPRLLLAGVFLAVLPHASFNRLRTQIYRWIGVSLGPRSLVLGTITFSGYGRLWDRLKIGSGCIINTPLHAELGAEIVIGNEVSIGHHVVFVTTDHEVGGSGRRCAASKYAPIVIEDGCWIGACVTILPGVRIGRGSIVAAGAVVSADVSPNKVVGGSPARPVKSLPEDDAPAV